MTIKGHFPFTIQNEGINDCIVFSFLIEIIIFAFVSIRQIRNVTSLEKLYKGIKNISMILANNLQMYLSIIMK